MKIWKQLLLLILCLALGALCLTACKGNEEPPEQTPPTPPPAPPFESVTVGDFIYYPLEDDTYAVSAAVGSFENGLTIPTEYDGKPVTQIGFVHPTQSGVYYGFQAINDLATVTVPACVKTIVPYAFSDCTALASVQLAQDAQLRTVAAHAFSGCTALGSVSLTGVSEIGNAAFENCVALRSVTLPSSLTTLGTRVFEGCTKLLFVTNLSALSLTDLPENLGLSVRISTDTPFATEITADQNGVELLHCNGTTYLFGYTGDELMLDLSAYPFTAIYPAALSGLPLTSVKLPAVLTTIGERAFAGASLLTKVSFADNATLESIGEAAFEGCLALAEITLPQTLTSIGIRAFASCESLREIALPDGVSTLADSVFISCSSLTTLTLGEHTTLAVISSQAFLGCEALTTLALPATLSEIGDNAFNGCTHLAEVSFALTEGWSTSPATEEALDLTDAERNATYLRDTYVARRFVRVSAD